MFEQGSETAERLRAVDSRLEEISRHQTRLGSERSTLLVERNRLIQAESARSLRSRRRFGEWRPERVRDVLLWLGVVLLALAAVTFTVVAWSWLDDSGRALLLVAMTAVVAAAARLLRDRLPATAEALTGLTLALLLVDWYAARHAGLGADTSLLTWSALGFAAVALISLAMGIIWRSRVGELGAAILVQVAAAAAIPVVAGEPWAAGLVAALVAGAVVAGAQILVERSAWPPTLLILGIGAVGFELGALIGALAGIEDVSGFVFEPRGTTADLLGPALAITAMGVAPALVARLVRGQDRRRNSDLLVGLAVAAPLGGLVTMTLFLEHDARWIILAIVGLLVVSASRLAPGALRLGIGGAAAALSLSALVPQIGTIAVALLGPLRWIGEPWSGSISLQASEHLGPGSTAAYAPGAAGLVVPVLAALTMLAAAVRIGAREPLLPRAVALPSLVGLGAGAVAVVPLSAGVSIGIALEIEVIAATLMIVLGVVADRRRRPWAWEAFATAALLMVPATGWALANQPLTEVLLAGVVVVVGTASFVVRTPSLRATGAAIAGAAAATRIAITVADDGGELGPAGIAVAVTGAFLLLAGAFARSSTPEGVALEGTGLLGLVAGAFLAGTSLTWFAGCLTVAVPTLALAALRRDRQAYSWIAVAAAVASAWAWLAVAGVELVEAYTIPAAAAALAAGWHRRRLAPDTGSWMAYGPGLAIALAPSTVLAVSEGGLVRALALTAGGLATVLIGARSRLQAPLVLGGATLVALAIDVLVPVGQRVPRWAGLAIAGLALLWLGSTAERRLRDLRRLRGVVEQLA